MIIHMSCVWLIIGLTVFALYDTYYDGRYTRILKSWKKYYKMGGICLAGVSAYAISKYRPDDAKGMMMDLAGVAGAVPMLKGVRSRPDTQAPPRAQCAGGARHKRSVGETKKKFVAAQQNWSCGDCGCRLPAWYEVDHKRRLDQGGDNQVDNLVALCRDCHGKKTALEVMDRN